jgi:hypothetical protein
MVEFYYNLWTQYSLTKSSSHCYHGAYPLVVQTTAKFCVVVTVVVPDSKVKMFSIENILVCRIRSHFSAFL